MLGFKGPRKMTIVLPGMGLDQQRVPVRPRSVSWLLLSTLFQDEGSQI